MEVVDVEPRVARRDDDLDEASVSWRRVSKRDGCEGARRSHSRASSANAPARGGATSSYTSLPVAHLSDELTDPRQPGHHLHDRGRLPRARHFVVRRVPIPHLPRPALRRSDAELYSSESLLLTHCQRHGRAGTAAVRHRVRSAPAGRFVLADGGSCREPLRADAALPSRTCGAHAHIGVSEAQLPPNDPHQSCRRPQELRRKRSRRRPGRLFGARRIRTHRHRR
jgi:hypothetical protein